MDGSVVFVLFGLVLHIQGGLSIWRCSLDTDCAGLSGSVCDVSNGVCVCTPGQQAVLGGTACVDVAPYHTSPCIEDHQCSRLFTGFQCRRQNETIDEGNCFCRPEHHYVRGRCWRSIDFGESCTRDEECLGVIRNPFSMSCRGTCQCADGFYERQRGDCRKPGLAVGDACVLDADCRFPGGVCNVFTLTCTTASAATSILAESPTPGTSAMAPLSTTVPRVECNMTTPCMDPFECSIFGVCICPLGYYESADGRTCLAELGSPSVTAQCVGFLAEVRNGICSCQTNFFYNENMRDCIRVTRRFSDSCVNDFNCHTFGSASRCGPPQEPWGLRSCECIPELSVWDAQQSLCRFFSGVGGPCDVDSDCQAGQLEIQCIRNGTEQGVCSCPAHLDEFEGLCLTTGLELGEACQHDRECTGTPNTVCSGATSVCACADGYQAVDDVCAPTIGGSCVENSDCVIENTECRSGTTGSTCQCRESYLVYDDICWPEVYGFNSSCSVSAQCVHSMGTSSSCVDNRCTCASSFHYRDGNCWPMTHLLQPCSRISECYLAGASDRVVCRNGYCHCDFRYIHSEEQHTCLSSATATRTSLLLLLISSIVLFNR